MAQLASELGIEYTDQLESQISAESRIRSSPVAGTSPPMDKIPSPAQHSTHEELAHHNESAEPSQATTASIYDEDKESRNATIGDHCTTQQPQVIDLTLEESEGSQNTTTQETRSQLPKRSFESFAEDAEPFERPNTRDETLDEDNSHLFDSQETSISAGALETRRIAFSSVIHESNPDRWGGLLSTTNNHVHEESELGEE